MQIPETLKVLIDVFKKFPGVGEKSSERMVFFLIENPSLLQEFFSVLKDAENLKVCESCRMITDSSPCNICRDTSRNDHQLLIVISPRDIWTLENLKVYRGKYFVLGKPLSPVDGVGPDEIHLEHLIKKVSRNPIREIIFALPPTTEGESTMYFLTEKLQKFSEIKITRLARGIPTGTSLELMDSITLREAYHFRTTLTSKEEKYV